MRRFTGRRVSPALVISIIALVLAASGTSFAAAPVALLAKALGLNSAQKKQVRSIADKQIAAESSKLSVLRAKSAESATTATTAINAVTATSATNATNAANATNAVTATSATNATNATNSAELGGLAASSYLKYGSTLPPGTIETGLWGGGFHATASGQLFAVVTTFPIPLSAELGLANTIVVSGASAPHCPGVGHAESGYLCMYVTGFIQNAKVLDAYNAESPGGPGGAGVSGFGITIESTGLGTVFASGNFAVTAP
jgi:hypothetical protein